MNTHHQTFLLEYFRTGDKKQAYHKAYPQTKDSNLTSSVNRLLTRPDIAAEIKHHDESIRKRVREEIEAQYRAELIDLYEAQATLSKIIRGELTREKWVKKKDHWETIQVKPSISETLRALNTFFRHNRYEAMKGMNTMKKGQIKEAPLLSLTGESPGMGGNIQHGQPQLQPELPKNNVHPFGNIYPPNYPGPYYDPDDPNTKEKLQNLRLHRLTDCPDNNNKSQQNKESSPPVLRRGGPQDRGGDTQHGQNNNKTQQNNQTRHFERREKSPEHLQSVPSQLPNDTAKPQEISSPESIRDRNDEQLSSNNNKTQQNKENSPPFGGGVAAGRGGDTPHGQAIPPITENTNKTQQPIIPPNGSKNHFAARQRAWRLKLEELRKEGWEHVNELFSEEYNTYAFDQNNQTWKMLKQFEKARDTRQLPAEEREKIAQETGWERHPDYPNIMRRRKLSS